MTPGDSIHAFSTTANTDPSTAGGHPHCGIAVLPSMFDPQAALEAARRLYREHRSGLRFFCENGQTVPIDQIASTDETGEFAAFGDAVSVAGAPLATI